MKRHTRMVIGFVTLAAGGTLGAGVALAAHGDEHETPITGPELERATAAALTHIGGGRVTGTEVGDEESLYEVEVTRDDGSQVDVQLDADFTVVTDIADSDSAVQAGG